MPFVIFHLKKEKAKGQVRRFCTDCTNGFMLKNVFVSCDLYWSASSSPFNHLYLDFHTHPFTSFTFIVCVLARQYKQFSSAGLMHF